MRLDARAGAWARRTKDTRPLVIIGVLAVVGLLIHQAWWSTNPLSAGDWHWLDRGRLLQWFPWPSVWDPSQGINGQNRFVDAFRFPVYAVSGIIAALGGTWTIAEKVMYFLPYAVLLPVAGWLLAREVMGASRWALLTPLLLMSNSYFLLEGNTHTPLTLAEVFGLLALVALLRTIRRRSLEYALATGLLLSICAAFDIRATYLTGLLMAGYIVVLAIADPDRRRTLRALRFAVPAAAILVLTQAYWWLPLLAYGTVPHLPTPQAPNFNVITIEHGITGVSSFWTGDQPANLVEAPLNPLFMLLPLLAMIPLLARRVSAEVAWLALAVVVAAFMAKTDTPPFGVLYDWMYVHFPGWRLFREGSKFLYVVAVGEAVLVPMGLRAIAERWSPQAWRRFVAARTAAAIAGLGVLAIVVSSVVVLESGTLGTTTMPTAEPASFASLSQLMSQDPSVGALLWFGSPAISSSDGRNHRFVIASATHSVENLTGTLTSTQVNQNDPLQSYCGDSLQPFCYLDPAIFPYIARTTGAHYLVAPGGEGVGILPRGITRQWLRGTLALMYGPPRVVGTGGRALDLWTLPSPAPAVTVAPAVALVTSGPWALAQSLPALTALDLPVTYTQSLDVASFPPSRADLPDAVAVTPRTDGGCRLGPGATAVFAESPQGALDATINGAATTLPLLSRPWRSPAWGVYGPLPSTDGPATIQATGAQLGPCVAWSPLAERIINGPAPPAATATISDQGGHVTAAVPSGHPAWVELRRAYDPGWRLAGARPTGVADGLFNLYHTAASAKALTGSSAVFQFSTRRWERIGQAVGLLSVLGCAALLIGRRRRRRRTAATAADVRPSAPVGDLSPGMASRAAAVIAAAGVALLAVAAVATTASWFGVPSRVTSLDISDDPYGLQIGYTAAAIVLLLAAVLVRLGASLLPRGRRTPAARAGTPPKKRRAAIAATLTLCTVVSGCAISGTDPTSALQQAQANSAVTAPVAAASLADAQAFGAANQPGHCIADYTLALTAYARLVSAYTGRASCYLAEGRGAPAAVHDLDSAISISPNAPSLYLSRAIAKRAAGDLAGATADFRVAAAIPSATASHFLQAIDGMISVNDPAGARAALDGGRTRYATSPLLHLAIADFDASVGRDADARAELVIATGLPAPDRDRLRALSTLCDYDVRHHAYQTAIPECTLAVGINASPAGPYDDRSVAELALGEPAKAIDDLTRAIDAFSGSVGPDAQPSGIDGFGVALLLEARGRVKVERGMLSAAAADFTAALTALPPGSPDFAARIKGELQSTAP